MATTLITVDCKLLQPFQHSKENPVGGTMRLKLELILLKFSKDFRILKIFTIRGRNCDIS